MMGQLVLRMHERRVVASFSLHSKAFFAPSYMLEVLLLLSEGGGSLYLLIGATFSGVLLSTFELRSNLHLMPVHHASLNTVTQVTPDAAWTVSQNKWFRANIIVWEMPKSLSTLEIRTKLVDLGLVGLPEER